MGDHGDKSSVRSPARIGSVDVDPEQSTVLPGGLTTDASSDASALDPLLAAVAATPGGGDDALRPGTVLGDAYQVEGRLGAGGMGVVYRAHDLTLDRPVAVKVHRGGTGADRLQREATAMARLAHPNVVTVHGVGRYRDDVFVAMEYLAGGTLRSWLREAPRTWREILAVCRAAGEGLAAAHGAGLVHRDFKPDNVLMSDAGVAKVGDFGLARAQGDLSNPSAPRTPRDELVTEDVPRTPSAARRDVVSDRLTRTGAAVGTPAYMAPEQFRGSIDARADQFALAVVTWEALFGQRPYAGKDAAALEIAVGAGPPAPPRSSKVPPAVTAVVRRALAPDPAQRYASVRAFLVALERAATARRRQLAWVGGVGVAVTAAVAVLVGGRTSTPADPCVDATRGIDGELAPAMLNKIDAALARRPEPEAALAGQRVRAMVSTVRAAGVASCRAATRERSLSPELAAKSSACLAYRARIAAVIIDDLELVRRDPAAYLLRLGAAPGVDTCLDPVTLAANPAPPVAEAAEARADLELAVRDLAVDQVAHAAALVAAATPRVAGDRAAVAMLAQVRGQVAIAQGDLDQAERDLSDAYYAGQAIDDAEVYLPALTSLVWLVGDMRADPIAVAPWLRVAEAAVERDRRRAAGLVVDAMLALAAVAARQADGPAAVRWAESARALRGPLADPFNRMKLAVALGAAHFSAGALDAAVEQGRVALAACGEALGAAHPTCALRQAELADTLIEADQMAEAVALARSALASLASSQTGLADRATALLSIGAVLLDEPGERDTAAAAFTEARDLYVALHGAHHPDVAAAERNLAAVSMKRSRWADAEEALTRALAIQEHYLGPGNIELAATLFNLGTTQLRRGALAPAAATATRVVAAYTVSAPRTGRMAYALRLQAEILLRSGHLEEGEEVARRGLALADQLGGAPFFDLSIEVARANILRRRAPAESRALLQEARAQFGKFPETFVWQLDQIDALLARLK